MGVMEFALLCSLALALGIAGGMAAVTAAWWLLSRHIDKMDREIEEDRR